MGLLFKLGWKNIGRNRVRSALTITAIVICSGGLLLFSVFFSGMMEMFLREFTNQVGHIRVIHPEIAKNERIAQGRFFVEKTAEVVAAIKTIPGVRVVSPRLQVGAFIDFNERQAPAQGIGIEPDAEAKTWQIQSKIIEGRMIQRGKKEVLLGRLLADRLQAKVGSDLTLVGRTIDDSMSALRVRVAGIFVMKNAVSDKTFLLPFDIAQTFLDAADQASSLLVFGDVLWKNQALAKTLQSQTFPSKVIIQAWQDTPRGRAFLPAVYGMLFVLGGLVIFVGGIGLLNTLMMSVLERRSEVGLMMALGLPPSHVAGVFLVEGVLFGVIGALSGILLGSFLSIPILTQGFSFASEAMQKVPVPITESFKGILTFEGIAVSFLVGVLATVVGSLWPAYKASRVEPVEALRKA